MKKSEVKEIKKAFDAFKKDFLKSYSVPLLVKEPTTSYSKGKK